MTKIKKQLSYDNFLGVKILLLDITVIYRYESNLQKLNDIGNVTWKTGRIDCIPRQLILEHLTLDTPSPRIFAHLCPYLLIYFAIVQILTSSISFNYSFQY